MRNILVRLLTFKKIVKLIQPFSSDLATNEHHNMLYLYTYPYLIICIQKGKQVYEPPNGKGLLLPIDTCNTKDITNVLPI